ncbi:choice-of-anchor I domain-containing protein [Pseudomonas zhanjiangensis]|uniref:Choice-of-anchor I domain-containing protein n=1 Tax=Pseudomonas zhanjiangensis TaxID=3239015 RepID=A0ABV3YPN9_9PSED
MSPAYALCALFALAPLACAVELKPVSVYRSGYAAGTEIVSVQASSLRVVVSNSEQGQVDVLALDPAAGLQRLARHRLLDPGVGEITSVAFHPSADVFAVAVRDSDGQKNGRVEFRAAADGELLKRVVIGVWPDSLAFSPNGDFVVVANEGEGYVRAGQGFRSAEGSISLIDLRQGLAQARHSLIALPDLAGVEGATQDADKRLLEREIDGVELKVPFGTSPEHIEPEYVAFSPDGKRAYVSLQENNAMAVVDVLQGKLDKVFGLGVVRHAADLVEDGQYAPRAELIALREPDGISVSPDGRYLLTADEGDTDPKASKTKAGFPVGGGRTVSVFDAMSGTLLGDTGSQLDDMAAAAGVYPDARSPNKGSEPEGVVAFDAFGRHLAVASLERADALALIDLTEPSQPRVLQVLGAGAGAGTGKLAPEGLAHVEHEGRHFLISALEKSGNVALFELVE